jgi:hypothetical protein
MKKRGTWASIMVVAVLLVIIFIVVLMIVRKALAPAM